MSLKSKLNNWYLYRLVANRWHQCAVRKDPRAEMERCYQIAFHKKPDIDHPKDLIEKIFWLTLYSDMTLWSLCADKYRMREYVKSCGLSDYLPKLLGKWDKAEDIDFKDLPNEFILKTNNGCATNIIVRDKSKANLSKTKKFFERELKLPFGYSGAQLHYTKIEPCIIAEELLHSNPEQDAISPNSLIDYKVWCINGQPESILIVYDRKGHHYCLDLYDTNWNRMMDKMQPCEGCEYRDKEVPKPKCLEQMLDMATILSKQFPEVRVDFYIIGETPIIGELTFTTGFGYFTYDYYLELGERIDLSNTTRI